MAITAAQLMVRVGADTQEAERGLSRMHQNVEQNRRSFGQMAMAGLAMARDLTVVAGGIQALIGGLANLSMAALKPAADFEQATIAMTGLLRSSEAAKTMLNELFVFAAKTPFEFPQLVEASQKLLAFGFTAQEIIPMMTNIGDAVAGLGGGAYEIQRVVRALGQMQARTKISAQEMLQLTEVGLPVWRIIADGIGVTTAELMDMIERGLLPASKAIPIILDGMNKSFGGQMQAQSRTFNGLMTTLADNLRLAWMTISGPLFERAKVALTNLTDYVSSPAFAELATTIGERLGDALVAVASFIETRVVPAFSAIGTVFAEVGPRLSPLLDAFRSFATSELVTRQLALLRDALVGIGTVLGVVAGPAVENFLRILGDIWQGIQASLAPALLRMQEAIERGRPAFERMGKHLEKLKPLFDAIALIAGTVLATAFALLVGVINGLARAFDGIIMVVEGLVRIFTNVFDFIVALLTGDRQRMEKAAVEIMAGLWQVFEGGVRTILGFFYGLGEGILEFLGGLPESLIEKGEQLIMAIIVGVGRMAGDLKKKVEETVGGAFSGVGDFFGGIMPKFADGGIMPYSGMAIVGERGREAVFLPAGSRVVPNAATEQMLQGEGREGTRTYNITVNGGGRMQARDLIAYLRDMEVLYG
jgi:tape measure domain-containing protein